MKRSHAIFFLLAISNLFSPLVQADTISKSESYDECLVIGMQNQIRGMFLYVQKACAERHPRLKAFINTKHTGAVICIDGRTEVEVEITSQTIAGYNIAERNKRHIVGIDYEARNFSDDPSLQSAPANLRSGVKMELNLNDGVISFSSLRNINLVHRYQCRGK